MKFENINKLYQRNNLKTLRIVWKFLILFLLVFLIGCGNIGNRKNNENNSQTTYKNRKTDEYTWGDFEALSPEEQEVFFECFDSVETFEKWMNEAKANEIKKDLPWNNGGKQPAEYTWEEFEALSPEEQEAFFECFDSAETFEKWMNEQKTTEIK